LRGDHAQIKEIEPAGEPGSHRRETRISGCCRATAELL
jgi:hypothetical protein